MAILSLVAIGVLVITIWAVTRYRRMTLLSRHGFPGPRPHFLFGNMLEIHAKGGLSSIYDEWHQKYGPIVGFYLGGVPNLVVADQELLKKVMVTDFTTFHRHQPFVKGGPNAVGPVKTHLVFNRSLDDWRRKRTLLSPAFTSAQLRYMIPSMTSIVDNFIKAISPMADSEEFSIVQHVSRTTLGVIARVAFGVGFGYAADSSRQSSQEWEKMAEGMTRVVRVTINDITFGKLMVLLPELTFIWYPLRLVIDNILFFFSATPESKLLDISRKVLNTRVKANKITGDTETNGKRRDLMQILMNARQQLDQKFNDSDFEMKTTESIVSDSTNNETNRYSSSKTITLTDDDVICQIYPVLAAGYETTAVTLQYLMYNLANHQDIQDQLRLEISKLKVNEDGLYDYESLMFESPFMIAVVRETLRLYTPLPSLVTRIADIDYHYDGRTIPAGTGVISSVMPMHLSETFWPEPFKWKPSRHLTADGQKLIPPKSEYAYQPFGHGPRNCVGMRLAYLEINLVLVKLMTTFRILPGPSTETGRLKTKESYGTMAPVNPIYIKLKLL